jgi:26S proteasome regulatory subunit N12
LSTFLPATTAGTQQKALSNEEKQEVLLVRETLEYATLLSAKIKDLASFERHVNQVKSYYGRTDVEKSQREYLILGLNLLALLAQNRIAEFHTELELIPIAQHSNMYIKQPIEMELYLMEGSYNKLRNARDKVPAREYLVFMDILMETVRKEIADCIEKAYRSVRISELQKLLFLASEDQVAAFANQRGWMLTDEVISFGYHEGVKSTFTEEATDVIARTLFYAKEMERII